MGFAAVLEVFWHESAFLFSKVPACAGKAKGIPLQRWWLRVAKRRGDVKDLIPNISPSCHSRPAFAGGKLPRESRKFTRSSVFTEDDRAGMREDDRWGGKEVF